MLTAQALLPHLNPYLQSNRWLIAYSGGIDSHVLLHLLSQLKAQTPDLPELIAIHIDHHLQDESEQWAKHCCLQAEALNIPIQVHQVDTSEFEGSPEESARDARYAIFNTEVKINDVLMMAHHADDQVETLLLRQLRGSGVRGSAAMSQARQLAGHKGQLFRPLLDTSRAEIVAYARANELIWIDDPSNTNTQFDRNFLRMNVLPALSERWPNYRQTLSRAARLNQESRILNDELAVLDIEQFALISESNTVALEPLQYLSDLRIHNVLRYWLYQQGFQLPTEAQLQTVITDLISADVDADPVVKWQGVELRRFNQHLYVMEPLVEINTTEVYTWNLEQPLVIEGLGCLSAKSCGGSDSKNLLGLSAVEESITIRFRQGGERCQPAGREHSQTLKKLFQEYAVEPWLRVRTPIIYVNDELAVVCGYWVCEGFATAEGEPGFEISLQ